MIDLVDILDNKKKLMEYIIINFSNIRIRYLMENTFVYSRILDLSYHPKLLKNNYARKVYFMKRLYRSDKEKEIIRSEIEQLERGDIPYFNINSKEKNLE